MINLERIPVPLNEYVLVKPEAASTSETKSPGGLFMPAAPNQLSQLITAEIVCTTSDKLRAEQKVLMIRQSGTSILINGEEHLLILEKHLLAVV